MSVKYIATLCFRIFNIVYNFYFRAVSKEFKPSLPWLWNSLESCQKHLPQKAVFWYAFKLRHKMVGLFCRKADSAQRAWRNFTSSACYKTQTFIWLPNMSSDAYNQYSQCILSHSKSKPEITFILFGASMSTMLLTYVTPSDFCVAFPVFPIRVKFLSLQRLVLYDVFCFARLLAACMCPSKFWASMRSIHMHHVVKVLPQGTDYSFWYFPAYWYH